VSVFYRPIGQGQLRELWARCDLCNQSGAFPDFVRYYRKRYFSVEMEEMDLCKTCHDEVEAVRSIERRRGRGSPR
jgi:hypothetical protein